MDKLYVDENLKVTDNVLQRKAIVNKVNGCCEITFLEPIARDQSFGESWDLKFRWSSLYYPEYGSSLPRAESLLFANKGNERLFTNCYTSSNYTDPHGRIDSWYMIDANGERQTVNGKELADVYVALRISTEEFSRLNPDVDLSKYQMSVCY